MGKRVWIAGLPLTLMISSSMPNQTDAAGHRYKFKDPVDLWVNKVGPYANPQEAYEYFVLPYCAPDVSATRKFNELKSHSIGESLSGHRLRSSGHALVFSPDSNTQTEECTTDALSEEEAAAFSHAAEEDWFYQMYLDDLPVWGMVGEVLPQWNTEEAQQAFEAQLRHGESDKEALKNALNNRHVDSGASLKTYVYTQRTLTISYNNDRIVQVDMMSDPQSLTRPTAGARLTFKLDVVWKSTTAEYHSRFDRYLDNDFFKHQIHWFSIFNSFMMVLFLTGLVALILLRTLKKDYARYSRQDLEMEVDAEDGMEKELDDDSVKPLIATSGTITEESGWKQVHGDVFRAPPYLPLFSALLGIGWQIISLTCVVILFAVLGPLHGDVYEERGEVVHSILVCYCLSSVVAGYTSSSYFKRFYSTSSASAVKTNTSLTTGSRAWQGVLLLTVVLLPTLVTSVIFALNCISLYYGTINTTPFLVLMKLFFIWTFVTVPLAVLGTLLGRHQFGPRKSKKDYFPCRVNAIPRPIPDDVPWYGQPKNLIPLAGVLPFVSIFIELYYVLTSLWNYKVYHVYGFLFGMYGILAIVVGMTSIIVTYFCLNAENYQWQWTSFFSGFSTAFYVLLYGVYYFFMKTSMHGLFQTAHYFGYTTLTSIALGTLCGTISYFSCEKFVKTIFQNVKLD